MNGHKLSFTTRIFIKLLTGFVLVSMIDTVNSMIDGIVIARLIGGVARNVMALYFPVQLMFSLFMDTLISGSGTICSNYLGKANAKRAGEIYTCVGFLLLIISLVFTFVLCVFPEVIAKILLYGRDEPEVIQAMAVYLRYRGIGTPAVFLTPLFFSMIQVEGNARICNVSVLVGAIANVAFDLITVYVFHGGIAGIGLATSLSVFAGFFVLFIYFLSTKTLIRFDFKHLLDKEIGAVIKSGLYVAVMILSAFSRIYLTNWIIIKYGGVDAMTAYSLFGCYRGILISFTVGIWNAAILMLGVYMGEENFDEIHVFMRDAFIYMIGFLGLLSALTCFASPVLIHIVAPEGGEMAEKVRLFMIPFVISTPAIGIAMFSRAYFQNLGKNITGLVFACAKEAIIPIALLFIMGGLWGISGVSYALSVESFVYVAVLLVYLFFMSIINRHEFERMIYMPEAYFDEGEVFLENKIYSPQDVADVSMKVYDFCMKNGREKTAMKLSLAVEELGNNVFTFSEKKSSEMDINVRLKKDDTILSVRDNGRLFDPNKWFELHGDEGEKIKNLGIRLILKLNKKVEYVSVFDMNFLQIRIGKDEVRTEQSAK